MELLADGHWYEYDLWTNAHFGVTGSTATHVRVDRGACWRRLIQLWFLEPNFFHRFVYLGNRRSAIPHQRFVYPQDEEGCFDFQ